MGFRQGPTHPDRWHGPPESFGTSFITGGKNVGLRDGVGGVGYKCGCQEGFSSEFGKTKYEPCDEHGQQDCGCYTFVSGNIRTCTKHKLLWVGSVLMLAAATAYFFTTVFAPPVS